MPTPAARQFLTRKLFDKAGVSVSVTTLAGSTSTITALVEPEKTTEDPERPGLVQNRLRKVTVCRDASLGYGSVEPEISMKVTIDSEDYAVHSLDLDNPTFAVLVVTRPEISQVSRPGFRNGTRRG